jgi:aminoglycoside phosphotransferase (APT) family kinase protein
LSGRIAGRAGEEENAERYDRRLLRFEDRRNARRVAACGRFRRRALRAIAGEAAPLMAQLFGVESSADADCLYLEHVHRASAWPWRDLSAAAAVCRALARLHDANGAGAAVADWEYEAVLASSAEETVGLCSELHAFLPALCWKPASDLRRLVAALPQIRQRLFDAGTTFLHGDVHTGNVIFRAARTRERVVLVDWSRARIGSPLEDAAAWLHSVGCWDAEVRRRHDMLLGIYLSARSEKIPFNAELRDNYSLAAACNGLTGAIRYHLSVAADSASPPRTRARAQQALEHWQRIVRRGCAVLTSTNRRTVASGADAARRTMSAAIRTPLPPGLPSHPRV